jgi:Ion channel
MSLSKNLWKDDKGFMWMLAVSILSLVSTQINTGLILESKFIVRVGYFLFIVIAIKSSSLGFTGKSVGYAVGSCLLVMAIIMIWYEPQTLILSYTVGATGYLVYIIALVINQIFTGSIITVYKIGGGVATYILIGLLWASLYFSVHLVQPAAFRYGGELIESGEALKHLSFFSFVTLTTIGYGDITAVSSAARVLAMLEGLLGQLFPAIFIAKLVSMQIESSKV